MKVPFKSLIVTSSLYRRQTYRCARNAEIPILNDGNTTVYHEQPVVLDRNSLFGTVPPDVEDRFQPDIPLDRTKHIPTGLRISGPTELTSAPGNDEGGEVIEEVDHFRFIVSKEELERAINAKSGMTVKQRLEGSSTESSFFIDAAIVQSLLKEHHEDNSTTTASSAFDLALDFDDFRNGISVIASHTGGSEKPGLSAERGLQSKEQHAYNDQLMATAERTVADDYNDSSLNPLHTDSEALMDPAQVTSGTGSSKNTGTAAAERASVRRRALWTVQRSLALTSRKEIVDDVLGVTFVMTVMTLLLASFDGAVRVVSSIRKAAQLALLYSRLPALLRRSVRLLALPLVSALAWLYWRYVHLPRRRAENMDWLSPNKDEIVEDYAE
jgi:hypothetical protein